MAFAFNPLLVLLSLVVAIQAGYVGLKLALGISGGVAQGRRLLIAGAALTLATGIWSMHFIGMLAVITPVGFDYRVLPTLLSFLVCVLVVGIAIYLASLRSSLAMIVAAFVMGLGIAAMHYVGMTAVHSAVHMQHDPIYVIASVVIAFVASGLALWLAFLAERRPPLFLCAILFGCAVSAMHYTAMAGTALHAVIGISEPEGSILSSDMIAVIVSIVTFSISGIFMLTLLPAENTKRDEEMNWKAQGDPAPVLPGPVSELRDPDEPALAIPTRPGSDVLLPIETKGKRFHISASEIVSVHANAHYAYVFNGRDDVFCPISITEIAERLPKASFFRTHRSHLVNLAFVLRVKKAGDAGVAELDAPTRRTVPVSRARVAALRLELAAYQPSTGPEQGA
jgi:diguanylate cyclase